MIWNDAVIRFRVALTVIAISMAAALLPTDAQAKVFMEELRSSRPVACIKSLDVASEGIPNVAAWLVGVFPAFKSLVYTHKNVNQPLLDSVEGTGIYRGESLAVPSGETTATAAKYLAAGEGILTRNFNENRAPVVACLNPDKLDEATGSRPRPRS